MFNNEKKINKEPGTKIESRIFARDIVWFTIAQLFISMVLGIITLPALTKSYSPEIYGIWIQVSVTVDLISPLLSLQLGLAIVKYLAGENEVKIRRALGSMLSAIVVFTCIISVIGILLSKQISLLLFASDQYVNYVYFLIAWTFFNSLFNFLLSYFRVRGKIREISIIQVAITVMKMLAILGLASVGFGLEPIVISMIALYFIFSLGFLVMITKEIGFPLPNLSGVRTFLTFSIPQMPVIILLWVVSLSDRYFITHFLGLAQNGIYSSSNTVANLISIFYMPISFVLFPLVSKFWQQKRSAEVKSYSEQSIRLFLTFAIPGAMGLSILSQPLLRILTTSEFLVGVPLVLLLAFGGVFLGIYQININLILLGKRAMLLPLMTAAASLASVVMNIILIPRIGIMGAAISNCASYFLLAMISTLLARKTISYDINFKYLIKVCGSAAVMLICLSFLRFNSVLGILVDIIIGGAVFIIVLILLRAFSERDKKFVRNTCTSFVPNYLQNRR